MVRRFRTGLALVIAPWLKTQPLVANQTVVNTTVHFEAVNGGSFYRVSPPYRGN